MPRAARKTADAKRAPAAAGASGPPAPARSLRYDELKKRSEDYTLSDWQTIDDLYVGGFQIRERAKDYLTRLVREPSDRYKQRVACTAYINYFGQITDYFAAALFTQEITVRQSPDADNPATPGDKPDAEFYAAFAKDCDGKGGSFGDALKARMTGALNKRRSLLALDMPRPSKTYASRADEEADGAGRVYAYEIPLEQVIDWDDDDDGGFRYLVIHRIKKTKAPPGRRTKIVVEEFKIWEKFEPSEPEDSALDFQPDADDTKPIVTWRLYRVEYPENKPPRDQDEIPMVDGGEVSFRRIPVLQMQVPEGLWVGNKVALMALEHYQGRSSLNAAEDRSLVSAPFVKKGSESGSPGGNAPLPSAAQTKPYRGSKSDLHGDGVVELGKDDEVGFWEPSGKAFEIKDRQLSGLKDEMFRVVHQMAMSVSNAARQVARSGESKKEDRVAEGIVLGALGQIVRKFAILVYQTIAEARGEDVVWVAHGLDDYETEDREQLLEEAISIDQVPINSPTFKRFHKVAIANRLCRNMAPEAQDQMRKEIEASVTAEESMRVQADGAEHDATVATAKAKAAQALAPPVPPALPGGIPNVKTPKVPTLPAAGGGAGAAGAAPGAAGGGRAGAAPTGHATMGAAKAPGLAKAGAAVAPPANAGTPAADPAIFQRGVSTAGVAETLYQQLLEDFPPEAIGWVRAADVQGPMQVPLDAINFSDAEDWGASDDPGKIASFVAKIKVGIRKPIVLVNEPNDEKLLPIDGHHRLLGYKEIGEDPPAYVVNVGTIDGPWSEMHAKQRHPSGSTSDEKPGANVPDDRPDGAGKIPAKKRPGAT